MSAWASGLAVQVEEFGALFERFERSAFRVEAHDRYDVDDEREEFAAFLKGEACHLEAPRATLGWGS
jgi:hypothetical protein